MGCIGNQLLLTNLFDEFDFVQITTLTRRFEYLPEQLVFLIESQHPHFCRSKIKNLRKLWFCKSRSVNALILRFFLGDW